MNTENILYKKLLGGKCVYELKTKNGKIIKFRAPEKKDIDSLLKYINGLIDEEAMILINEKINRKKEIIYLNNIIKENKNKSAIHIFAEYKGKVIGNAEISKGRWREKHVGSLGIGISKEYRGLGIGKEFIKILLKIAKENRLKLITLEVYKKNTAAKKLYVGMGFRQVGEIPKKICYKGGYEDILIMARKL